MGPLNVKKMLRKIVVSSAVSCLLMTANIANAASIDIDEIIYEGNDTIAANLSGTVEMVNYDDNWLRIIISNTSSLASSTASQNLLTGIGFNLPGLSIIKGEANVYGQNLFNFKYSGSVYYDKDVDVSGEWGYDNTPITSGPFQTGAAGEAGMSSSVNTVVSSMVSTSETKFSSDYISRPRNLDGPEFGLLSGALTINDAGGLAAIQDTITIDLELSGSYAGLEEFINSQDVVLSFGSPDQTTSPVPIPAAAWLLGTGLLGIISLRKKQRKA